MLNKNARFPYFVFSSTFTLELQHTTVPHTIIRIACIHPMRKTGFTPTQCTGSFYRYPCSILGIVSILTIWRLYTIVTRRCFSRRETVKGHRPSKTFSLQISNSAPETKTKKVVDTTQALRCVDIYSFVVASNVLPPICHE